MLRRGLLALLALVVTACGGGLGELEAAPLPESFEGGPWALEFRLDLEPGFWEVGPHRYQIWLECEELGPRQWSQYNFETDTETELIDHEVYVRLRGLSLHKTGPSDIKLVNTEQPTIAIVTVLGLEEDQAGKAAGECAAELRLEDGTVLEMPPGSPFRV